MPRTALLGWFGVALSLVAPSAAAEAAPDPTGQPVVHTAVTEPSRPVPAAPSTPVRVPTASEAAADRLVVTFASAS